MSIFRSIVFSAVLSGLIGGAAVTVLQYFSTVPLILKAETYEHQAPEAGVKPTSESTKGHAPHNHASHEHEATAWKPAEGLQRNGLTAAANILTAIGFSLLLAGFYAMRGGVDRHEALLWGLSGFVVFTAAPGLGLPPELPGAPVAALGARQLWWTMTALATALGMGLIFLHRAVWATVLGFCLVVSPHLVGAPQHAGAHSDVPDALSHQFVVSVTITSLLFWALLGCLTGVFFHRFSARSSGASS